MNESKTNSPTSKKKLTPVQFKKVREIYKMALLMRLHRKGFLIPINKKPI